MPTPHAAEIVLTDAERVEFEGWARRRRSAADLAMRSRIVLAAADGGSNTELSQRLGLAITTVRRWRNRFAVDRLDGLLDEPRRAGPGWLATSGSRIDHRDVGDDPAGCHALVDSVDGRASGIDAVDGVASVAGVRIDPAQTGSWKLSRIRYSSRRSAMSSGCIWIRPSVRWCCASTRRPRSKPEPDPTDIPDAARNTGSRQPRLRPPRHLEPVRRARPGHRQGHRITTCTPPRPRIPGFLQKIDAEVPDDLDCHVVLDNASTHKTPAVKRWLTNHPRFVLHFTPTSSSWLNLVERWFAELTTKKLRRSTHTSVRQLNADIRAWIETWNDNPSPYVWTKTADQILDHHRQLLQPELKTQDTRGRPRLAHSRICIRLQRHCTFTSSERTSCRP